MSQSQTEMVGTCPIYLGKDEKDSRRFMDVVKLVGVREEDEEQRVRWRWREQRLANSAQSFSAMLVNNTSCDFLPGDGRAGCG